MVPRMELGGVERGVVDLARKMKEKSSETVVISSGGTLVGELQKSGITHYKLPIHKKSILSLLLVSKIVKIIERERIDIVHARSRVPAWIGWLAARRAGVPFVTTCHGYYSTHFLSRSMGWGKRVIVPSHVVGRHMIDDFSVSPDAIRLIPRGVDLSQFTFSLSRFENKKGPFRIIHVGRFSPIKGQVEFLKSIHLLRAKFPYIEVWLVGSEGKGKNKYTELIKKTIHQFGLESSVKLLGTSRDIPGLLSECDLLVMSTLIPEAFGRVIIEAGAVGTPVISTRVGGVLDIIEDGKNGLLVDPKDINKMADGMLDLLKDREKARSFAIALREKVEKEFSLEKMVERNIQVYSEVRKRKKILIIKLGAMGDLILSVPSFRMVQNRFSDASLTLIVDKKLAPLIAESPYLRDVILVHRKRLSNFLYLLKIAKRIRKEGFDVSIDLQNTKWTYLLAFLGGIPKRFGFSRGKLGFLLNRPDKTFEIEDAPVRHQYRILSKIGVKEIDETLELWPKEACFQKINDLFKVLKSDSNTQIIGFVVGSSPKWETKRWPVKNFSKLAEKFLENSNIRIILLGSAEDRMIAKDFGSFPENRLLNLIGKTSLEELVCVISKLNLLVTGDTAPLHIACAVNVSLVALFGPTDSKRHMPPNSRATVLSKHLPCQPCYNEICKEKETLACLTHISVNEVLEACKERLNQNSNKSAPSSITA